MIEVSRTALREALELVASVARPDAANPTYQTVTILAAEGRLTFEAQSEFEVVRTSCECTIKGDPGPLARFAIRPASLLARVSAVNSQEVRIDTEKKPDSFVVRVRAGTACWRLETLECGVFPTDLPTDMHPIDGAAFAAAFSRVQWAASADSSRPNLHGIIVVPGFAFASDGVVMARVALEHAEREPFIAPLRLAKVLAKEGETVRSLGITSRYIAIEFGASLYASRRPAAEPAPVEKVFAKILADEPAYACRVVAKDLAACVVAATVGGRESKELDIESIGESLVLRTPTGDTASAKCDGNAPTMTVVAEQIKSALSGCTQHEAILKRSKEAHDPLTIHQDDGSYVALLMPMRKDAA